MHTEKAAIFSVIFPANLPFIESYLKSLVLQDEQAFEVVLLTDQVPSILSIIEPYREQLSIHTYPVRGTVASIREQGLDLLRRLPYKYIIFSDTDDVFSPTRVRSCLNNLTRYPVVVNDLTPFKKVGEWSAHGYWGSRLEHETIFSAAEITRFNFVGLGNTSIRKDLLLATKLEQVPNHSSIPDWFIFFQILQGAKGIFVHEGTMHYRQHENNMAGVRSVDRSRLQYLLNSKISHYSALSKSFPELNDLLLENQLKLQRALQNEVWLSESLNNINNQQINYFWWEETEYMI